MTDPSSSLQQLWQKQTVSDIDWLAIRRRYRRQKVKQWGYAIVDLLGLAPFVYVFVFARGQISALEMWLLAGLALVTLVLMAYVLWLRRLALFGRTSQTLDYAVLLTRQTANNAVIARITKHTCWAVPLLLGLFFATLYWQGELSVRQQHNALYAVAVMVVLMAAVGYWAHRRERRFLQEARQLRRQLRDLNKDL